MYEISIDAIKNLKTKAKNKRKFIFNDKIVNIVTEPMLFNVQDAATTMQVKQGVTSVRATRKQKANNDLVKLSQDTLLQMNIAPDTKSKSFSLLEEDKDIELDANPAIIDRKLVNNIMAENKSVKNNFPDQNDPILELDDGNYNIGTNNSVQDSSKNLSKILSDINILNKSDTYYGKNKYYLWA